MPNERTRAVIQTREFLVELSQDKSLPMRIRGDAIFLLRHFPSDSQMLLAGYIEEHADTGVAPMGPIFSSTIGG
ncbi:BPSL0761 family protein [Pseudomonas sp. F01002]|uniref:BPSL0761 family protein n=1 Tax=Pseudomonas sp. F01002 TaxID=2555724 RepID=UPI00273F0E75|nr:BPSL0761 family protein [Pseudomonas sp. F01002]